MKGVIKLNNKGLTLIELLIGMALLSLVMAAVFTFLVMNINFSNTAQDEIYIQEQVRNAMKVITDLAMDQEKYSIVSSSHIKLQVGATETAFKYEDGAVKYISGSNTKVIASNIKEFKVENIIEDKLFKVTIKGIKHEGTKKEVGFELTNQIFLRN